MAYKQQTFISHSSGDWEFEIRLLAWLASGEGLLLGFSLLVSSHDRKWVTELAGVPFIGH